MKIVIVKDYDEMSKAAAELAVSLVQDKPHAVLSFATGSTPLGMYAKLASHHKMGLDFSGIKAFHLDEYIGLSPDDPMSYSYYLDENVFTPLEIPKEHIFVHNSDPEQVEQHAREYDRDRRRRDRLQDWVSAKMAILRFGPATACLGNRIG